MFEISIKKRLQQLFCKHNYFAVAVTDHFQDIGTRTFERASIHKCDYCEHVRIIRKGD